MNGIGWYGRPVAASCAALALVAASASILAGAGFGDGAASQAIAFAVTIRRHGVDARELERSVAMPLEDALSSITGATGTSSASEYGKVRVVVGFSVGTDHGLAGDMVRDAVGRVYDRLPASTQRPEIRSTSDRLAPVWVASVCRDDGDSGGASLGQVLEHSVKPALGRLDSAGDVELAGTGVPELVVEVDEAAAAALGIGAGDVAGFLADSDTIVPAGAIRSGGTVSTIVADGRCGSVAAVRRILVPTGSGTPVPLCAICRVEERDRKPEALSRVDGKPAITVAVFPGAGSDLPELSRDLAHETAVLSEAHGLSFRVLADEGAELAASFRSTLSAAVQGALAVGLASAMLVGTGHARGDGAAAGTCRRRAARARLAAVAAVPCILVVSAAALAAVGLELDRHSLVGLSVGLGSAVDTVLLASERLGRSVDAGSGKAAMMELAPSLASGTMTTLVVLVPLAGLDFMSEGVARVASAIGAVCVVAWLVAMLLLPPLVLGAGPPRPRCPYVEADAPPSSPVARRLSRCMSRLLAMNARLCAWKPWVPLASAAVLGAAGVVAMMASPIDPRPADDGDTVQVHVEFEPGTSVASVDERLAVYATSLAAVKGIDLVHSTARRGYGSVAVSFDPAGTSRGRVAEAARTVPVQGGFAWVPEPSPGERSWELTVAGDDDGECRLIAVEAARAVSALPFVIEMVLNFKDGPEDLLFIPDRERGASLGTGFSRSADALRRGVHGPVAYKRLDARGETDVRVTALGSDSPAAGDALSLLVMARSGPARIDSLMTVQRRRDASSIRRMDRRRVAVVTIRAKPVDPRTARVAVDAAVAGIARPAGCTVEFDRDAVEAAVRLAGTGLAFVVAAALAYMATAAVTESFGAPLAVMSSLPPSLAVPALFLAVSGACVDAATACAFVAVSGMAVNASVLTVGELRLDRRSGATASPRDLYRATRIRIGSLAATTGTTVAGALPFILLPGSGGALARSLAFVAAAGTAASFIVALTVVPALASAAPRLLDNFTLTESSSIEGRRP